MLKIIKGYVTKTKLDVNELVLDETTEPWVVLEKDCTFKIRGDVIDKLADYEDLEEQGRLIKLPCKVGDTVYVIVGKNISVQKIQRATIDSEMKIEFCTKRRGFALFEIGKTVFLTKSEAEAKLKELRGGESE